jgi:uncharacterized protein YdeI (YjbR/CyaY-like superfamily)
LREFPFNTPPHAKELVMAAAPKKRPRHPLPASVKLALRKRGVLGAYNERPAYQRNDYLGWIDAAHRDETKAKRMTQMVSELEQGGVYMGMKHAASAKRAKKAKAAPKRAR